MVINIQGTIFEVEKSLLESSDFFSTLLDISSDTIVIDRDPTLFAEIIRFADDRNTLLDKSDKEREVFISEMQYYDIPSSGHIPLLIELCDLTRRKDEFITQVRASFHEHTCSAVIDFSGFEDTFAAIINRREVPLVYTNVLGRLFLSQATILLDDWKRVYREHVCVCAGGECPCALNVCRHGYSNYIGTPHKLFAWLESPDDARVNGTLLRWNSFDADMVDVLEGNEVLMQQMTHLVDSLDCLETASIMGGIQHVMRGDIPHCEYKDVLLLWLMTFNGASDAMDGWTRDANEDALRDVFEWMRDPDSKAEEVMERTLAPYEEY